MFWDKEKIDYKKNYFKNERTEKKGKFTEFVVRTYYCIYKACSLNNGRCCEAKSVSPHKIKYVIYDGFYNNTPDHDFKNVIDDCFKHLKLMKYIKFKKVNDIWMIYLNKPLDFLPDGEHENYIKKYNIINPVFFLSE